MPGQSGEAPTQIHDFNPGVASNGLVWTVPLPSSSVTIDLDGGTASLNATVALGDYGTVLKAFTGGAATPASATFAVNWATGLRVRDKTNGFSGNFSESIASISWSATESGFSFVSDAATHNNFSLLGQESNGAFFS